MSQLFTINSEFTRQAAHAEIDKQWEARKWMQLTFNYDKTRTGLQNSSLHLYCTHLSKAFNDAGYDMTKVLSHHADIPWDLKGFNVKEKDMEASPTSDMPRNIDNQSQYQRLPANIRNS